MTSGRLGKQIYARERWGKKLGDGEPGSGADLLGRGGGGSRVVHEHFLLPVLWGSYPYAMQTQSSVFSQEPTPPAQALGE